MPDTDCKNIPICAKIMDRLEQKVDKISENQFKIITDVELIKKDVNKNTADLAEHKEGVIQNRKRITALERPSVVFDVVKNTALWLSSIIGLILILRNLNVF